MARKSIDFTRSLLNFHKEFNSREREKRQNLRLDLHGATRSNLRPPSNQQEEDEQQQQQEDDDDEEVAVKHDKKMAEEETRIPDEEDFESLRAKFTIQNNSLSKNNAVLTAKVSDLESKVGELINENMSLRKTKTFHNLEVKQQLNNAIEQVENNLITKFEEIFQFLKKFRESEGLPVNDRLGLFPGIEAPLTESTPTPIPQSFNVPTTTPFATILDSESNRKSESQSVPESASVSTTASRITNPDQGRPAASLLGSTHQENIEPTKVDKGKRRTISVFEDCQQSADDLIKAKQIIDKIINKSRPADPDPEPEVQANISLTTSKSLVPTPEKVEKDAERPRRPLRNRGEVNYKQISLRGKMRRATAHFVDAVDENAYVNYTIPTVKSETNNEKKRRTLGANEIPNKRKPLGNKTNTYTSNTQTSKDAITESNQATSNTDQLSVFDFEEIPSSQSKYIGRRKGGKTNGRYTTFTQ